MENNQLLDKIISFKKMNKISFEKMAENLPISPNSLATAFRRKSVDDVYLLQIAKQFNINKHNNENYDNYDNDTIEEPVANYQISKLSSDEVENIAKMVVMHEKQLDTNILFHTWKQRIQMEAKNEGLLEYLNSRK